MFSGKPARAAALVDRSHFNLPSGPAPKCAQNEAAARKHPLVYVVSLAVLSTLYRLPCAKERPFVQVHAHSITGP